MTFGAYNAIDRLDALLTEAVGCVVLELVRGRAVSIPPSRVFVAEVAKLAAERGILVVVDEVRTGFGRTGRLFACGPFGLEPDLLCLAKSMHPGGSMRGRSS